MNNDELFNYIDSILEDDTSINNIDFLESHALVENNEGNIVQYEYSDTLSIRVFKKVIVETVSEFISLSRNKKIYVITHLDCEPNATFNTFSYEPFCDELKNNDVSISDIDDLTKTCWGLLKGSEKEVTFKQLKKIMEEG